MKFFCDRILITARGEEMMDGPTPEQSIPLTLGNVAAHALSTELQQDAGAPYAAKLKRGKLFEKVLKHSGMSTKDKTKLHPEAPLILATEEVAEIKQRIGLVFEARIVVAADRAIEGDESDEGQVVKKLKG